ncbi:hypothetical protein Poly30_35440 [Planctomycetes bacterium Poly30]|uniref:Uncharacterized protein n=1 Tax=Saltatorellus ferox TaxID=2528018 RepID=A0A518EVC6_9BACT|nr:hypothetical protein Poly30_35440 [Planctomycetes bacterium Poly30]
MNALDFVGFERAGRQELGAIERAARHIDAVQVEGVVVDIGFER